jgi:CRP-like cAMP-binding protein
MKEEQNMLETLFQVAPLRVLPIHALARLAEQGRRRNFAPGAQLMRQGQVSESLHIILTGHVRVTRSHPQILGPVQLAELGPGDIVGEMGVLDQEPRSATVTAQNSVETLELDGPTLAQTIVDHPEAGATLLRMLSRRLRSTDELLERLAYREPHFGREARALRTA